MIIPAYILTAVISYLLGSLNFGVIVSNKLKHEDVRNHGSGNAGTTNMLRNYGEKYAVITIAGDMLKVAVAIFIAFMIMKIPSVRSGEMYERLVGVVDETMFIKSFAGFFCVLGHIFPCFFGFKGGKGVATAGGMVFCIDWRIALILLAVFIVIVLLTKYVSLGSIVMALLYPVFMYIFHRSVILTVIALVFTVTVIIAHRNNIVALCNHTEHKITDKKPKEK
ncbi:MAG: glycerol-3-phosphate 1-O-acyltransferase PlsY [Clostridiales bacterium]|nr:glycerol-3-phosphate 1-O-acyltransferase PlsY [Clostridiales bacterium]